MQPCMTIDARMLFSSGIGRYLREILSRWPSEAAADETYYCNQPSQIDWLASHRPGSRCLQTSAGIYSLKEQMRATSYRRVLMSQLLNDERIKQYVNEVLADEKRLPDQHTQTAAPQGAPSVVQPQNGAEHH